MTAVTVSISVPGISCDSCQRAIEGALRPLPGVASAAVDVAARVVRVTYEEPASLYVVRAAIEARGYHLPAAE